jgi:hypothetical protein
MAIDYSNPYQEEILGADRQRKLADALLKQGLAQNNMQGQMVSGRFVGASPWQGIANLAQIWAGKSIGEEADAESKKIAEKLRTLGTEEVSNIMTTAKGREASQQELAGPAYQGVQPSVQYPAMQPNQDLALTMAAAARTPEGRAFAPALMANALPKNITPYEKEALRQKDEEIALRERELKIQAGNANKPQIFESSDGGVYAVDPRNPNKSVAVTFNGQPITGKKSDLPEFQGKATLYGIQMSTGLKDMNTLEKNGFNPSTFKNQAALSVAGNKVGNVAVSPEVRSYKQGMDNFANAYIRIQSGANVPEQEIMRNLKNMMPAMGDDNYTLNQKANAREEALRGVRIASGQGAKYIEKPNAAMPSSATGQSTVGNPAAPAQTQSAPLYATNGKTRIVSTDGGNTWQPAGGQ